MVRLSRTLHSVPQWQYFTAINSVQRPEHEFLRRSAQKHKTFCSKKSEVL